MDILSFIFNPFVSAYNLVHDTLTSFLQSLGVPPDWIAIIVFLVMGLIVVTVILIVAPVLMMYITLMERKVVARMQDRIGPNRVGKFGLLQPIADMIKFLTKEDIVPQGVDGVSHFLAPIVAVIPVVMSFAVIYFGVGMGAVDLNLGLLFLMAMGSMATIAVFMAGFGSHNKFALIGGMRAAAQIISYEIPQIFAVLIPVMLAGSISLNRVIEQQSGLFGLGWFILYIPVGPIAFFVYLLAATAEINRVPFDLPEAESELVAGYHTEYSGMKFGLFYLAEFLNMFIVSAIGASIFFGGWQGPFVQQIPALGILYFFGKTFLLILIQLWFRGSIPRLRVDQLMNFGWKRLVPVMLGTIMFTAVLLWFYRWFLESLKGLGG
ncbi:MAG: NADH-quinone oxidoreductase subunit H [Anaerolineae bacterium]|nr:NADH-quinone oxidoreductase subunit H [Anaerolineae bacterium]RIK34347.1 MAG: NADH-quinone oxidoreductase subunit NuoH [Chloroflexota bacterium]